MPGGRASAAIARAVFTRAVARLPVRVVFPGGLIPSVTAIEDTLARHTRLQVAGRADFGPHYAQTLRLWRERFTARLPQVAALGFDEVFTRMWQLYLSHAEAGFASGYLDVCQFLLEETG